MPAGYAEAKRDPWEGFNRDMFAVNEALDDALVKPATLGYRAVVPAEARQGVTNVFNNLDEPLNFVTALMQGKFKRAFRAVDRLVINSTLGAGGLGDPAAKFGLPEQPEDLGQALATWGIASGPYLVLPLLGPSTLRDAFGFGVERAFDPAARFQDRVLGLGNTEQLGLTGLQVLDLRSNMMTTVDPVIENALDPYTTIRSAYIQARLGQLHDGAAPPTSEEDGAFGAPAFEYETAPAFDYDDASETPAADPEPPLTEPLAPQPDVDPPR